MLELQGFHRQISVFRLEADDWQTARDVRLSALTDSAAAFLGDEAAERGYNENQWRAELDVHVWFVARLDDKAVGLAKLNRSPDQSDGIHLEAMWVAPDVRRRGVGEVLVSALEATAASLGAQVLRLWVFTENRSARDFYLRLGYRGPLHPQKIEVNGRFRIEEEFEKRLG
ncbi:GNAT family N-acetyltransferase [Kribbella antibiotica]|uniref:GNAT family N-acetyltransferase n=1 Tax=Kribbella antibiotica TaxID=190195 RepID=UPI00140447C3|nr:GNAT family N-acetyltransferase [Kribbella antibiotica]